MIKIQIEGQTLELPPNIAVSDDAIRRAIAPVFPQVANASFIRTSGTDGTTIIKVTKQAGTKGYAAMLAHLTKSPNYVNPVFTLYQRLFHNTTTASPEEFFSLQRQLEPAIREGESEIRDTKHILDRLAETPGHASTRAPLGF
ncbi:MAG: hypothetical protein NDI90_03195 [Nitrospira sp. BO4]|jgi:hypothetical protein|nr:hypothetical protein [Nitrospira sp. BO4]